MDLVENNAQKKTKLKIPTRYLPEDWREIGATEFSLSTSAIEKVAYGIRTNTKVFDFLLALAEKGKSAEEERIARTNLLAS